MNQLLTSMLTLLLGSTTRQRMMTILASSDTCIREE